MILPSRDDTDVTEFVPGFSGLDEIDDPLLTFPIEVGGQMIVAGNIGLAASGLGYLIDPAQPTRGVEELLVANGTVIGIGEIDLEKADEKLQAGTEGVLGEIRFEEAGEIDNFALYEPVSGDLDGVTAVSETAVLIGDTRNEIQTVIDTRGNNHRRAVDETDSFGWGVDTAGHGHLAMGWCGGADLSDIYMGDPSERPAADLVSTDDDVVSSVTFSADTENITARFAVQSPELGDSIENRLKSRFGSASQESSFTAENDRITATGTYPDDILDLEFTEPEETVDGTETTDSGEGTGTGNPPAKVAEAVPDGAFEFSYTEKQQMVRVDFVKEFEADKVTVRSVEGEGETSISTTGSVTFLNVFVDSEGDEVIVTVTVDGVTGTVARREFP